MTSLLAGVLACLLAVVPASAPEIAIDDDGRADLTLVLSDVFTQLELDVPGVVTAAPWLVKVTGLTGRAQLRGLELAFEDAIDVTRSGAVLTVDVNEPTMRKAAGDDELDEWLKTRVSLLLELRPEPRRFGLRMANDDSWLEDRAADAPLPAHVVVLVHGLDDPGWLWRDMQRALLEAGYTVLRFEYANDGPIAEASARFASSLETVRTRGTTSIDIVAHSMGGLVSRDVLTRDVHYGGDGRGGSRFPAVNALIMCGTPNHGSELARFRAVSELGEHVGRMWRGGDLFGATTDGDGEAGRDLLPGSAFLAVLNARPLAKGTRHTVIAGRVSPIDEADIARTARQLRGLARAAGAPGWLERFINDAGDTISGAFDAASDGLGDGVVTLESARLDGAAFIEVDADHISMIVSVASTADPPAIALVRERLTPLPREAKQPEASGSPSP